MINRLRRDRNRFRDECYALRIECEKIMTRIKCNDMESQLKKKQDEITILKNKNFRLNQDYIYLYQLYQNEKKSYHLHCDKLKNDLDTVSAVNTKQQNEISRLNMDLNSAHEINKIALQNIDQIYNMYINILNELAETKNENNILKSDLIEEQKLKIQLIKQQDIERNVYYKQEHENMNLRAECDQLYRDLAKLHAINTNVKTDADTKEKIEKIEEIDKIEETKEDKEVNEIIQSDNEKDDDSINLPTIDIFKLISTTKNTKSSNDLQLEDFDILSYDE